MVRLGLKVFYLRTHVRELSQQGLANTIGVRQATLSNIERGLALPTVPLLIELARFFDVTPTFLLDDERGVIPRETERWSTRNGLVSTGMWIEVESKDTIRLSGGRLLCPLVPGTPFYDDEARARREEDDDSTRKLGALHRMRAQEETELVAALSNELAKHPRARRGPR